jgi:hypothetical protein
LGLTVDDLTNEKNANRVSIKTAVENYLLDRRFGRPRSIAAYENAFNQSLENLTRGVKFIDQLATLRTLNTYVELLRGQVYGKKSFTNRMGFIFSPLKANGAEESSKLMKLPKLQLIEKYFLSRTDLPGSIQSKLERVLCCYTKCS